jgi:hypothetical protein
MSTFVWPSAWCPQSVEMALVPNTRVHTSPYTQDVQVIDLIGERWRIAFTLPGGQHYKGAAIEAYFARLRGRSNRVALPNFLRMRPRGTLHGSPTLYSAVAKGAQSITLQTTPGATLLAGDTLGIGDQLLMIAEDAVANGSGLLFAYLSNRVRTAQSSGFPAVWDRPTIACVMTSDVAAISYDAEFLNPVQLEFMETWS